MPNTRSAAKRMRADAKRRLQNLSDKTQLKTLTRKFHSVLQAGQTDQAQQLYGLLTKHLDQAAKRGILHRNTASRKKSRLARRLAQTKK